MYKYLLTLLLAISVCCTSTLYPENNSYSGKAISCAQLYQEMNLQNVLNYKVFEQAIIGQARVNVPRKNIITIIDFSKPSDEDRLFVLDLKHRRILFSTVVAHGKNSGDKYATSFSNINGSNKSSIGFFVTDDTYKGRNGYSLRLNGLEEGINDNARERAIVIHGANYADPELAKTSGRLGRSLGCPALPKELNRPIIDAIKGGTLIYIYGKDQQYFSRSSILSDYNASRFGVS